MGPGFDPWRASIISSSKQHGWCADDGKTQYLQIDLGTPHHVTGVVTKGLAAGIVEEDAWVEKYRIQYSVLGEVWTDHQEQNVNKVSRIFFSSFIACITQLKGVTKRIAAFVQNSGKLRSLCQLAQCLSVHLFVTTTFKDSRRIIINNYSPKWR